MKSRLSSAGLLRIVVPAMIAWSFCFGYGDLPATAAANGGTIAGTFFADTLPLALAPGPGAGPGPSSVIPGGAAASAGMDDCEKAVANASAGQQLPPGLLGAIAVVESGRVDPQTGNLKPWPWTIDANGTGYVYSSQQAAIAAASQFQAAGITSLDVGCLQVNLAQHPDAFSTLAEAFNPVANADYAAAFLTSLEQKFGNWPQAVAAYHSQTPGLGQPYAAKVYATWQGASPSPEAGATLAAVAGRGVTPGQWGSAMPPAFDLTALMPPMARLMRPFNAPGNAPGNTLSNRGLASYRAAPVTMARRLVPQG